VLPRRIKGTTHTFTAPDDWDGEYECHDLHARIIDGKIVQSAWEPTPKELEILNRGGSVILSIWGSQPPVSLTVENSIDGEG